MSTAQHPPKTMVGITVVSEADPHGVPGDALAQVIEHELRRRLPDMTVAFDARTTVSTHDPRRRTRWKPAAGGSWMRDDAMIVDIRAEPSPPIDVAVAHVPVPDVSSWFAGLIDPAALETRRLMLAHLGITAPTDLVGLTATDHVALGTFDSPDLDADVHQTAVNALDRIADLARDHASGPTVAALGQQIEALRADIDRLRAEHAAWEHATHLELERRGHAIRSLEQRIEGDGRAPS